MKTKIYPIGSFSGWRDEFIQMFPEYRFKDPRNHNQGAVAKVVFQDMKEAMNCPISLVYLPEDKRAGTMSYAELGGSRAKGNCIIAFDEDKDKDDLIKKIASHYCHSRQELKDLLKNEDYFGRYQPLKAIDKTATHKHYESILFTGDIPAMQNLINKMKETKKVSVNRDVNNIERFAKKTDLIVVNFDKGKSHNRKGLFFMGLGYALDVPVLELEANIVPYPVLPGLARRTLFGPDRFIQAQYYLQNLTSQHIEEEAPVYYALMKKFNLNDN